MAAMLDKNKGAMLKGLRRPFTLIAFRLVCEDRHS